MPRKAKVQPTQPLSFSLPTDIINMLVKFSKEKGLEPKDVIRIALRTMIKKGKYFDLDSKLTFGKYAGETMQTVIKFDAAWVMWCMDNVEGFSLSDSAADLLEGVTG